jgi:outer membrane lipoprotein-sorting protein
MWEKERYYVVQAKLLKWSVFLFMVLGKFALASSGDLKAIEAYHNQLKTLQAHFQQTNFDGKRLSGKFYLWRPGLMRLEYAPPSQELIVADGTYVTHMRKDLDEVTSVAIDSTPAAILLGDSIQFDKDIKVVALEKDKGQVLLTLNREGDSEGAELTLIFNERPLLLTEWIVKDADGRRTHVQLDAIQTGVRLPKSLFKVD